MTASSSPSSVQQDASVPDQYDRWARIYDRFWRRYMNHTLPVVQKMAAVAPGERVLDVACGTGELLHRIAQTTPSADLTGVDLAPAMVARARSKLRNVPHAQVEPVDAHHLPFEDASFDVLLCANTFHYFTHPAQVLSEAQRVLRADGRLVILDWCRDDWTCRIMDAVLPWVDPAYETCYTLDELTAHLAAASLVPHDALRYRFDLVWGMMAVEAHPRSVS